MHQDVPDVETCGEIGRSGGRKDGGFAGWGLHSILAADGMRREHTRRGEGCGASATSAMPILRGGVAKREEEVEALER